MNIQKKIIQCRLKSRDPGLFIDDNGCPYIVFGTWDFYIAKLNEDMISFAETS